jgi:hypothetical protein
MAINALARDDATLARLVWYLKIAAKRVLERVPPELVEDTATQLVLAYFGSRAPRTASIAESSDAVA